MAFFKDYRSDLLAQARSLDKDIVEAKKSILPADDVLFPHRNVKKHRPFAHYFAYGCRVLPHTGSTGRPGTHS